MKVWVLTTYGINGTTYRVFSTERQVLDAFAQCSPILRWSINECEVEGLDQQQSRPRSEGKGRCEASEKTLTELMWDLRGQLPGVSGYYSRVVMLDARLAKAEAADRLAEAWLALGEDDISSATWDAHVQALAAYKDAREAVRKLEQKTEGAS